MDKDRYLTPLGHEKIAKAKLAKAIMRANAGEKTLADVMLLGARWHFLKAGIPLSEESYIGYHEQINEDYQRKGIESKIKENLIESHLLAAEGSQEYKSKIHVALGYALYFEDDSKMQQFIKKIESSRDPIGRVYEYIGLTKLKAKKSEEIREYARKGDFKSMARNVKESPPEISFSEKEKEEFYTIYRKEGPPRRIEFLLDSARAHAKNKEYGGMMNNIKEAKELSLEAGIYKTISTWFKAINIKNAYLKNVRSMLHKKND
ncbi:MAG: hypothetical protein KKE23_01620 [Nanoarchaeota archaeon]|nr:hypothetical protein [Nanoarchaeota archaeon]